MAFMNWDNSLSVSVAEIDRQHQKWIGLINDLHEAMKGGKGGEAVGKIIKELIAYTQFHFGTEEKYFKQFGYPDAEKHIKLHKEFVDKVQGFKNDFEKGKITLTIEVMNFLMQWLKNHIQSVDKQYSAFFNAKGLK